MGCALFFAGKWNSFFLCDHIQSKNLLVCFPSGTIVLQAGERLKTDEGWCGPSAFLKRLCWKGSVSL